LPLHWLRLFLAGHSVRSRKQTKQPTTATPKLTLRRFIAHLPRRARFCAGELKGEPNTLIEPFIELPSNVPVNRTSAGFPSIGN